MKKQLLIAAVAATMTSVAMADISITGAAQVNYTNTDFDAAATADTNTITHDVDLKISGSAGATTVVMDIENTNAAAADASNVTISATSTTAATVAHTAGDNELNVKNVYMTTSIAGVNVKAGTWYGSDSLLGNGSQTANQISLDTTVSGVKVQYEDNMSTQSVTLSGSVSGVALSHEIFDGKTDTSVSGSFAGVNAAYRSVDSDTNTSDKTSLEVSTEVQGATLTYANINAGTDGTSSDAFFGTFAAADMMDATGFGAKMDVAGNTVNVKSFKVDNTSSVEQKYTKVIVTRALASGATLEATYTDKKDVSTALDLELRVAF